MKFMKLGSRSDTFFTTAQDVRSVTSDVSTDIEIQVQNTLFQLHKFPLLSKCLHLQKLCSKLKASSLEQTIIDLDGMPGGADAFEICAKFCYGITITLSALNIVPVLCAAEYLEMTDAADRGNLAGKIESFFSFCLLRRWKDTLLTLRSTTSFDSSCETLGITGRCIDSVTAAIVANHTKTRSGTNWWIDDISGLGMDHYSRIMVAVRCSGIVPNNVIAEALQFYASNWLLNTWEDEEPGKIRYLMEKIVSLLPGEKGSASCSFLLQLLKVANLLPASTTLRTELSRRIGLQLEEVSVDELLIPGSNGSVYDADAVLMMLDEFLLQQQSIGDSEIMVAKLIDCYLQKVAIDDTNFGMEKLIAIAEAVPDLARANHDDLYRVIDIYLRSHPNLDKNERKQLCRILDCKKLSVEARKHAQQNEHLPLTVVVQVLFFQHSGCGATPIRALLAKSMELGEGSSDVEDGWRMVSRLKYDSATAETKVGTTLRMKLDEAEDEDDDDLMVVRSYSARLKTLWSLPRKPKRVLSRLLRSASGHCHY